MASTIRAFAQLLRSSGTTVTLHASGARFSYHLTSEDGSLLHNSCAEGVRSISLRYRCPTIQASYINEINALLPTRRHGGIAVASEDGTVVYQAPDGRETLVVCDVTLEKIGGSMLTRLSLIK